MKKAIILSLVFHLVLLGIYTRPNTKIIDEEIKTRYKVGVVSLKESDTKGKEEKITSPSLFNKEKIDNATKKVDSPKIVKEKITEKKPSTRPQLPKPIEEVEKSQSEKTKTAAKEPEKYEDAQVEKVIPKEKDVAPPKKNHPVEKEPTKEEKQDTEPLMEMEMEKEEEKQEIEATATKPADTQERNEEVKAESTQKETAPKASNSTLSKPLPDENILDGTSSSTLVRDNSQLTYSILKMPKERFPQKARRIRIKEDIIIEASFIIGLDGRARDINLKSGFKDYEKYGFAKEVKRVIKGYRFSSIYYREERVEVLFHKIFIFRMR